MSALSPAEISAKLASTPGWSLERDELVRLFEFPDFLASIAFVNQVAQLAEAAAHHPDIDIRYNKVRLALTTHDAGGITAKDFDLAAKANQLT
jgi:4a-hydroxytetrahydrobiopterin dehydratase